MLTAVNTELQSEIRTAPMAIQPVCLWHNLPKQWRKTLKSGYKFVIRRGSPNLEGGGGVLKQNYDRLPGRVLI